MNEPETLPVEREEKPKKSFGQKALDVFWRVAAFLGFRRHSPYVKDYFNSANMRSGIFMSLVIIGIEVWMIIRRVLDTVILETKDIPTFFQSLFNNTSNFWLLLAVGIGMLGYCWAYIDRKKHVLAQVVAIIGGTLCVGFGALLPLEKFRGSGNMRDILLISLYVTIILMGIAIILATIHLHKRGKSTLIIPMAVISLFALVCLVFGVKVSYSDFFSTKDTKMIICFLMMSLYVGCLLIWRPIASTGILGVSFLAFYFLLIACEGIETTHRHIPDGDVVNYITFFISLTMVCFSIYHQRYAEATKEQRLHELATTDSLTKLMSFDYFLSQVRETIDEDPSLVKTHVHLFVDIDGFSLLNDQKGFGEGNAFLKRYGEALTAYFPRDLICRQGEDHFSLFVSKDRLEEFLSTIAEKTKELDPELGLGVAVGSYVQTQANEDIRRCVDKARHAAQIARREAGIHHEYGQNDHDAYHLRQYVIRNVERACAEGWIQPYYQPIVSAKTGKVVEFEALTRWIDPKRGFLSPISFIPALEEARLIHKLDVQMIELVCRDYRRRIDEGLPAIPCSINVSRSDFDFINVPEVVAKARGRYGVPIDAIHIEITESALSMNESGILGNLEEIHKAGYQLWLDDFGSGYSSFNVLKDFAFDVLKIDMVFLKTFGSNPKTKEIVNHIIRMSKSLNMECLCEGVETKEQAKFLRDHGCDYLQGFLIGKPMPYEESNVALKKTVSID